MRIFVVANWKMNPVALREARELFTAINNGLRESYLSSKEDFLEKVKVVICAPFIYLFPLNQEREKGKEPSLLSLGAEDCFWENKGSFTGETSPSMLRNLGCKYVIIGHSERRKYSSETDETVNKKIKAALKNNLNVILCVDKLSQIEKDLQGILKEEKNKIMVAYEPLWAIGSGKACSYEEAKEFNLSIKETLGDNQVTLYGGSVDSSNAVGFINKSLFQGLLIGGASLKSQEFLKIIDLLIHNQQ